MPPLSSFVPASCQSARVGLLVWVGQSCRTPSCRYTIPIFGWALLWALSATAKLTTADVVGTVHDPTGAVIANANVAVTNLGTGQTRTAQTGPSGDFVINLLSPGTYSVKV